MAGALIRILVHASRLCRPPAVSLSAAFWLLIGSVTAIHAQEGDAADSVHWAYAAYFGMGRYKIDSGESVYQFSLPPGKRIRRARLDERGDRTIGIEFRVPVTVGLHEFDDASSALRLESISTVSAVPGVEFNVPVTERWSLKPTLYVGWGTELGGDASAWIYWAGIKSQLTFSNDAFDWALVNELTYLSYSSGSHQHNDILPLLTGFEFERPLANKRLAGNRVRLHWHIALTNYLNEFAIGPNAAMLNTVLIDDEWEIGAAFSTEGHALCLRRLCRDRIGITYRLSSDGDFKGFGLVFRSLFDR